jgi:hypothetical protein
MVDVSKVHESKRLLPTTLLCVDKYERSVVYEYPQRDIKRDTDMRG